MKFSISLDSSLGNLCVVFMLLNCVYVISNIRLISTTVITIWFTEKSNYTRKQESPVVLAAQSDCTRRCAKHHDGELIFTPHRRHVVQTITKRKFAETSHQPPGCNSVIIFLNIVNFGLLRYVSVG